VIDRRTFLAGTGAVLLAAPLAAEAQQSAKRYRIAFVAIAPRTVAEVAEGPPYKAFVAELRRLGYVEGQNVFVERDEPPSRACPFGFPEHTQLPKIWLELRERRPALPASELSLPMARGQGDRGCFNRSLLLTTKLFSSQSTGSPMGCLPN
jgi:hypothetical protein